MFSAIARLFLSVAIFCVASAALSASSTDAGVSSSTTVLPFRIIDAEFSTPLNAIIAIRDTPNQLTIYDPDSGAWFAVNLPVAPTCVGVSPNGLRAIVGHNGWISEVDLSTRTVVQTFPAGVNVTDVIHGGNGYAYVFGTDSYVRSINLNTGAVGSSYAWRQPATARRHPALDRIYAADRNSYPDGILRMNLVGGQAIPVSQSVYGSGSDFCGDAWISADGMRIFTACGNTFRASADPSLDMQFAGKLAQEIRIRWVMHSAAANSIAVLPGISPLRNDNQIHYYDHDSLLFRGMVMMPDFVAENKTSPSRGRWLFFNAAGTKQYVVVQADSTSGIVNDYGLVTIDCTNAVYLLWPSTTDAPGDGGTISFTAGSNSGCVWTAKSSDEWLQTTSTGVGSGTVSVNVRPNTTSSPRQGTITIGNFSATITQPPAAPETVDAPAAISTLPFRVTDAEFSQSLNSIVAVSENALYLYNTDTHAVKTVSLDSPAFCVAVSPDGLFAAVGHNGTISYVDLIKATVAKKLSVSTDVLDIILAGNGYVYAFPRQGQWEKVRCVNINTNTEYLHAGNYIYSGSKARLHPGGNWIYSANNGLSPADIEKLTLGFGPATYAYDSPYHGDYGMCGNLWISQNGSRIYTACGDVFRSTADRATDMTYLGRMNESRISWADDSQQFGSIAVVPSQSEPRVDHEIHYYSTDYQAYQGKYLLPLFSVEGKAWQSRGRWHFFSANGVKQHVIVQADPESGILHDYGVTSFDCSTATTTLSSPAVSVGGDGATVQVSVTTSPGCGWKAIATESWLNSLSSGVTDGIAYITVAANPDVAPRSGTVSIGNQTFTINQAAAAVGNLTAIATSPSSVSLSWGTSVTANHFEVWRNSGSGFSLIASPQSASYTDTSAPSASGLIYKVRGVMDDSTTTNFTIDYAHTFTLTDPTLVGMPIRALHIEELRTIVNSLRAVSGAGTATYTDPSLPGVPAKVVHITQLRDGINAMRGALGMSPLTFSAVAAQSQIRAATTQELRGAIE
jgi:hypothetical protein